MGVGSAGDDSLRQSHLKVGASADIPLDIAESDLSQLAASVTAPSGRKEPCQLKRLRDGHVGTRLRGRGGAGVSGVSGGIGVNGVKGGKWGRWGEWG